MAATISGSRSSSIPGIRTITEERRGDVPLFVHPEWAREFPWLVQGITARTEGTMSGLGDRSGRAIAEVWRSLRSATDMQSAVLGRQVHGAHIMRHGPLSPGLLLADESDGHITDAPGVLLAVSVADCVPVFVVDAKQRRVAAVHAGWRGTAAGILRNCLDQMRGDVRVHFGPAICGTCYEVGPEVHTALGLPAPAANTPLDLRAVLAGQCSALGIDEQNLTTSSFCTRCGDSPFFSHRAGHPGRQAGVIGIRSPEARWP